LGGGTRKREGGRKSTMGGRGGFTGKGKMWKNLQEEDKIIGGSAVNQGRGKKNGEVRGSLTFKTGHKGAREGKT